MKTLLLTCLIYVLGFYANSSFAGEFTGASKKMIKLLKEHNYNYQDLKRKGHRLVLGEFTGAGAKKNVDLTRIKIYLTGDDVYPSKDIRTITLGNRGRPSRPVRPSRIKRGSKIKDLHSLNVYGKKITKKRLEALIVK